jgi:putative sterol carrier protein
MDIRELFSRDLPLRFASNPLKFRGIGGKFQINVTGLGSWVIDTAGPEVREGTEPSDVTITIAEADAQKLLDNPTVNAMALYFSGALKIAGNQMLAMKLSDLLG